MKNKLLLNRRLAVYVPENNGVLSDAYLGAALRNIERLGFTFSEELITRVRTLSADEFVSFYEETVTELRKMVGDHVAYQPFYPNFPQQVKEMPELTLYINAILHYLTLGKPLYEVKERFPLIEAPTLKVIQLADETTFAALVSQLFASRTSLAPFDKDDIRLVIEQDEDSSDYVPSAFTHKENMAFILSSLLQHNRITIQQASVHVRTATDVLRLAVAMSGGDVSLAQASYFRKFTRAERRFLLNLLEKIRSVEEDMASYRNRWVRLGEILHPGEYASRFPKTYEAFCKLRNNVFIETFASKVEAALKEGDVRAALSLLSKRPGELARRLDHLLRLSMKDEQATDAVLQTFEAVSGELATPVLLQMRTHFTGRDEEQPLRAFFPKGNVSKVYGEFTPLIPLATDVCRMVVDGCETALKERFSALPSLGKVYVEESMENFIVPFSQRSASKSLHTLVRGSRLDIPEGDTLRFFLWWKEGMVNGYHTGSVDIDLSAVFFDEEWGFVDTISYYNLEDAKLEAYHSGDIVTAPKGASEFIDVSIPKAIEQNCRYVVMSLNSFSLQPYKNLPECFAGWMTRKSPNSGEVYEPSTVENKLDVTADTTIAMPVIFDLVERKAVWCDLSLTQYLNFANNVDANKQTMAIVGKAITSFQKPNLYDLFRLHAEARGVVVQTPEEADISFATKGDVTPYEIEAIMSEYLV